MLPDRSTVAPWAPLYITINICLLTLSHLIFSIFGRPVFIWPVRRRNHLEDYAQNRQRKRRKSLPSGNNLRDIQII